MIRAKLQVGLLNQVRYHLLSVLSPFSSYTIGYGGNDSLKPMDELAPSRSLPVFRARTDEFDGI